MISDVPGNSMTFFGTPFSIDPKQLVHPAKIMLAVS
jgi:hypothetical protein